MDDLDNKPLDEDLPEISEEPHLRCARCDAALARADDVLSPGDEIPVYANPHGLVFELILLRQASGAMSASAPDPSYSWFKGYAWQIGLCRSCGQHVGWFYVSTTGRRPFWGLIRDRVAG